MLSENLIVLHTDWASDSIMTAVADQLIESRVKSTWFVTNDGPAVTKLLSMPELFEVGIHPNFNAGSSQGNTPHDVVAFLMKIVPRAKSVTTHTLMQSTPLLKLMCEEFGLLYDASLLLPNAPNLVPHELYFSEESALLRFPAFWEDDVEFCTPKRSFSLADGKYSVDGLKIFAFHPIHVALNSRTPDNYARCKSVVDIPRCSVADLTPFVDTTGPGTGTFFRELIQRIKTGPTPSGFTISELATKWRAAQ